jgi:hypothetical protein
MGRCLSRRAAELEAVRRQSEQSCEGGGQFVKMCGAASLIVVLFQAAACTVVPSGYAPSTALPRSPIVGLALLATWTPTRRPALGTTSTQRSVPTPTETRLPSSPTPCPISDAVRNREAGPIYLAVLIYTGDSGKSLVVAERPALDEFFAQSLNEMAAEDPKAFSGPLAGLSLQTLNDFLAAASQPLDFSTLHLPFEHQLLTDGSLDEIIGDDLVTGWERFDARFPDAQGYWEFSPVGLDCELRQALVFIRHVYGYAGMTGTLYLVARQGEEWAVSDEFLISEA